MDAGLCRLHRIALIMDGGRRTGEIVDLVYLDIERKRYVVPQELKAGIYQQMRNVCFCAGKEIVRTKNIVSLGKQTLTQVRP